MKNCVVFNDLSGYGNCSLMAAIPVLTVMGVRVHPVPTAVLTRQTGYDRYSMEDLTGFMPQFTADWQEVQPDGGYAPGGGPGHGGRRQPVRWV